MVRRVLELRTGEIHDFSGNYSYFLIEREVRRELQAAAFTNQQKKLEQERRFIERFRYKASLATRVQSRVKLLEKRELLEAPDHVQRALEASFQTTATSGRVALSIRRVEMAYGPRPVLTGLSRVERGERVAWGANGVRLTAVPAGRTRSLPGQLCRRLSGLLCPTPG